MKTPPVESYIVRIYRRQGGAKRQLVGLVEAPSLSGSQGFTSMEQLWEILLAEPAASSARERTYAGYGGETRD